MLYFLVSFADSGVESFFYIAQCTLSTFNCGRVDGDFHASSCKQQTPNLAACSTPLTVDFQPVAEKSLIDGSSAVLVITSGAQPSS